MVGIGRRMFAILAALFEDESKRRTGNCVFAAIGRLGPRPRRLFTCPDGNRTTGNAGLLSITRPERVKLDTGGLQRNIDIVPDGFYCVCPEKGNFTPFRPLEAKVF
mgnify:FL=1